MVDEIEAGSSTKVSGPICGGCGAIIRPDWIIDDVLCPYCLDKLREAGPSWVGGLESLKQDRNEY